MTLRTIKAQGSRHDAHGPHEIVNGNSPEHLGITAEQHSALGGALAAATAAFLWNTTKPSTIASGNKANRHKHSVGFPSSVWQTYRSSGYVGSYGILV
jgi:hypothetical protein